MPAPNPQRYRSQGRLEGVDDTVLDHAVETFERIRAVDPRITPVLTLRHLSHLTDIPFLHLRDLVGRRAHRPYKFFYLKKRIPGRNRVRMISVPNGTLMSLQRWIVDNILQFTRPHAASFAFHPDCRPYEAAAEHCGCAWLLKIDLEEFFHTVSEGRVAAVFENLGFPRLLSFEFARLTTVACERPGSRPDPGERWPAIPYYQCEHEGMLPQGAPTSPMLANLAMLKVDEILSALAEEYGMTFTRYADDLAFSCGEEYDFAHVQRFKRLVLEKLNKSGFRPNHRKTVIRGPGTRRIVLGMLVDSERPRLPREYKDNIRMHLHYLTSESHGPSVHAASRQTSVSGIFHHVRGLIAWAETVEPDYGARALENFESVDWPPLEPNRLLGHRG
ncbi:reverse transcriptase family protein [Rhodovulum marinum]|uniref:RNA-directed DNA polymerase n=1 Tax=Rhodovulum marinum TaxID=320662 RepID=A0A4V2SQK7_9RHOB|nr:reverse transcriptase family protein [Rhodovulum marinum]TCP39386.1 RNA-directed DNA polymerase [Rhodovulum marinum]